MSNKHSHSDPDQDGGKEQKRKVSGELHVRGEVVVDSPPEVRKADAAQKKNANAREDLKIGIEFLSLLFIIMYAGLTAWLAISSQQSANAASKASEAAVASYEATVRPYLGVTAMPVKVAGPPSDLEFSAILKNYGTIPAKSFEFDWNVVLDDKTISIPKSPTIPADLPPGETTTLGGALGTIETPLVMNGTHTFIVYVTYNYNWRDKHEHTCEKSKFLPNMKRFADLGPICYPN